MKKNDRYIVEALSYTSEGYAVAKCDGMVLFVPGMIVGEVGEVGITKVKKTYAYARLIQLQKESEHRVTPKCASYRLCGGCQLWHMDTAEQRRFKEEKVKECFRMNAHMDVRPFPILATPHTEQYRNKVQVPFQVIDGNVQMGFYQNHTNRIIEYDNCIVQTELSNRMTKQIKQWVQEYQLGNYVRYLLVKHAHRSGEVMVCFIVRKPLEDYTIVEMLKKTYPEIKSIVQVVNDREDNVIMDGDLTVLYGVNYIVEMLLGCAFTIQANSFFQINPYATEWLYQTVLDYASLDDTKTVIDLYCGTGTIGILASKHAKQVYGIEVVEEAIVDAKKNAKLNHVSNIEFFAMDAGKGAQALIERNVKPDVVIVDPPRKGCSQETLDAIVTMSPEKIVYVSCDPATLARDCAYLQERGFEMEKLQPVDMFPGTIHVETVCCMYHQKKDFISVPYEPKNDGYLK